VGDVTTQRFPWEPVPIADTVALLQRDFAYAIQYTAVLVRSNRPELQMLVNTQRGQIVPHGECKFTDGSTFELQDLGMPQVGIFEMTVKDLLAKVWEAALNLGLELEK
jgi:hypothetical protein